MESLREEILVEICQRLEEPYCGCCVPFTERELKRFTKKGFRFGHCFMDDGNYTVSIQSHYRNDIFKDEYEDQWSIYGLDPFEHDEASARDSKSAGDPDYARDNYGKCYLSCDNVENWMFSRC